MFIQLADLPATRRLLRAIRRWRAFTETPLGARLLPVYASLLGAGVGVLVADRLVRSMWRHAIFTGPQQWRTVALLLTLFWIAIGAVAALALLGPPDDAATSCTTEGTEGAEGVRGATHRSFGAEPGT
jgi:hypothetical protein